MKSTTLHSMILSFLAISCMEMQAVAAIVNDDSTVTITNRLEWHHARGGERLLDLAWQNPAMCQYQANYSLSEVKTGVDARRESEALNVQLGSHETTWVFDASSYMKHSNSTLWGRAYYNNGRIAHGLWNETADYDMVHPYVLADSVSSAAMKLERYSFGGGYATRSGKWSYGAMASYTAGLYYRSADPRPRNVTARLSAGLGLGYELMQGYVGAVSLRAMKYKQTNQVSFYSELGIEKLFHLTGFTNHYTRFAGTGTDTYYQGMTWAATLNLHPVWHRGLSASLMASHMKLDNVLSSLNSLPLARVSLSELKGEVAWLGKNWALKTHVLASRRVGTENIFGDPTGSIYLPIGSIEQYFENKFSTGLSALWQWHSGSYGLMLCPAITYEHDNVLYKEPESRKLLNRLTWGAQFKGTARWGSTFHVITLGGNRSHVLKSMQHIAGTSSEMLGLERALLSQYALQSSDSRQLSATLASTVALDARKALCATVDWVHGFYCRGIFSNYFSTSIAFVF